MSKIKGINDYIKKRILFYSILGYISNPFNIVMLGIPQKLEEFGIEKLKGGRITDVSTLCGTYVMGGTGFFGLKVQGEYGVRWLNYCKWSADDHILYDGSSINGHLEYNKKYKPRPSDDNYSNRLAMFRDTLSDMIIQEIVLTKEAIEIILTDSNNKIHSLKSNTHSEKFTGLPTTPKKIAPYEPDEMKEYWLVNYDETVLKV